ncbi:MAG: hypothetical protein ACLR2G_08005 [Phascolarctobacterium faecium]
MSYRGTWLAQKKTESTGALWQMAFVWLPISISFFSAMLGGNSHDFIAAL